MRHGLLDLKVTPSDINCSVSLARVVTVEIRVAAICLIALPSRTFVSRTLKNSVLAKRNVGSSKVTLA